MSRLRRSSCAWAHAGARLRIVVRACAHTSLPATAWRGDRGRRVGAVGEGRRIPWLLLTFAGKIACSDRESSALRPNLSCEAPRTARTRQCSLGEAMCTCPFLVGRRRLRAQDRVIIKMEAGSRRSSSAAVQCALQVALAEMMSFGGLEGPMAIEQRPRNAVNTRVLNSRTRWLGDLLAQTETARLLFPLSCTILLPHAASVLEDDAGNSST